MDLYVRSGASLVLDDSTLAGSVATELTRYVPQGADGAWSEVGFRLEVEGYQIAGTVDMVEPSVPRVTDWKTTRDLRFALSTLSHEPQPILYSAAFEARFGEAPHLRWAYVSTETLRVRAVESAPLRRRLHVLRADMDGVLTDDGHDIGAIPRSPGACMAFGRQCDHYAACWAA